MQPSLCYFILVAYASNVESQFPQLSREVRKKYDVILLGKNLSKGFEREYEGICSTVIYLHYLRPELSLSLPLELENVIVMIYATDLDDAFKILLQVREGPSHWLYLFLLERKLSWNDSVPLRKFSDIYLAKHLKINSFIVLTTKQLPDGSKLNPALELYAIKKKIIIKKFFLNTPLQDADLTNVYIRRQNFWNESIEAVAQPLEAVIPGQLSTEFIGNSFKFVGGFDFDILKFVADALNFSIVPVPGHGLVNKLKNGSLTGMAQQILNGEADISIVSQEMLKERKEHLTFLFPTSGFTLSAFMLRKSNNRLKDILFRSFEISIWLVIVSTWLLLAVSMWVIKFFKNKWNDLSNNDDEIGGHSFVWAAGTARQIGWHVLPDSIPMRIIFICGQLMGLVIYNAYSAAFTSILSTDSTLIQKSGDIAKFQYKVLVDDVTRMLDGVIEKLEGKKLDAKSLETRQTSFAVGIPQLYTKHVAYVSDPEIFFPHLRGYLYTSLKNTSCSEIDNKICNDIIHVRVATTSFKSAWFVKKHSPLAPFLNQKLVLMNERGLRHRYKSIYSRDNALQCPRRKTAIEASEPMVFTDIWTVYIILIAGTLTSVVLLVIEKLLFKFVSTHFTV